MASCPVNPTDDSSSGLVVEASATMRQVPAAGCPPGERSATLDIVKAVAIFLVVLGHCIQYGSGSAFLASGAYFSDPAFKLIYSFHMPLFMLVSGYLFASYLDRHSFAFIMRTRFTTLLFPVFVWVALAYFAATMIHGDIGASSVLRGYVVRSLTEYWFISALFGCSLIVALVRKFLADSVYVYLGIFMLTFVLPDSHHLSVHKFMYPFFVIAYLCGKHDPSALVQRMNRFGKLAMLVAVLLAYGLLMILYEDDTYIYESGITVLGRAVWPQVWTDVYRIVVGLAGSGVVILAVYQIQNLARSKIAMAVATVGRASIGIYLGSGVVFSYLLPVITAGLQPNYLVVFLEAVAILCLTYGVTAVLSRFKITRFLFLGGRTVSRYQTSKYMAAEVKVCKSVTRDGQKETDD